MHRTIAFTCAAAALLLVSTAFAGPFVVPLKPGDRISMAAPAASAHEFVVRAAAIPAHVDLSLAADSAAGDLRVLKFHQVHHGLPVIARGAAVAFDRYGNVTLATASVEPRLPAFTTPTVDAAFAAAAASQRSGLAAGPAHTRLVVFPSATGGRLAWAVTPPAILPIPYAPVVVVDAGTGAVLYVENRVRTKNAFKVWEFNPIKTPTMIDVTLPIPDGTTDPKNELIDAFNCVDTKAVKKIDAFGFKLDVHLCELQKNAPPDGNGDFVQHAFVDHTSGGDPFAMLAAYYHANKAYDWFRAFDNAFLLHSNARPLTVVANLMLPAGYMSFDVVKMADPNIPLEPLANAMYTGWDPQMGPMLQMAFPELTGASLFMGQGAKTDFALDGDVIYHEFGHAVVDSTIMLTGAWHLDAQGATAAPGGMNEGMADYFSSAITGDGDQGEYAGSEFGLTAIRHLTNDKTCPGWLTGEVHADSEFFSAPLWQVREALTAGEKHTFDGALFGAMKASASGDIGYEDLAEAFVAAVKASSLGQTVADALTAAFTEHGILPKCRRVLVWDGNPINSKDVNVGFSFTAPGMSSGYTAGLAFMPSLFQVEVPLITGTTTLTMAFSDNGGGGGGNPFGSTGTPFTPAFIVRFDGEIAFDPASAFAPNTDIVADAAMVGGEYQAKVGVPSGALKAYAMLVNKGDQSSQVSGFNFTLTVPTPADGGTDTGTPDAGAPDTGAPDAGAPDAGTTGTDAGTPAPDSGTPAADAGPGGASTEEGVENGEDDASGCSCATVHL